MADLPLIRSNGMFTKMDQPNWRHARNRDYISGMATAGIDTGVIIEGEGILFIGRASLLEMAGVMGWHFIEDWAADERQYQEDLAWERRENERLQAENAALKADLETFGRAMASWQSTAEV